MPMVGFRLLDDAVEAIVESGDAAIVERDEGLTAGAATRRRDGLDRPVFGHDMQGCLAAADIEVSDVHTLTG